MLKKTQDPVTDDEIRVRMAKISGKILDKIAQTLSAKPYEPIFMDYFKVIIKDKN